MQLALTTILNVSLTIVTLLRVHLASLKSDRIVILICPTRQYQILIVFAKAVQIQRVDAQRRRLFDGRKQLLGLADGIVHQIAVQPNDFVVVLMVLAMVMLVAERKALHVDLCQIGIDILSQILVIRQLTDAVVRSG